MQASGVGQSKSATARVPSRLSPVQIPVSAFLSRWRPTSSGGMPWLGLCPPSCLPDAGAALRAEVRIREPPPKRLPDRKPTASVSRGRSAGFCRPYLRFWTSVSWVVEIFVIVHRFFQRDKVAKDDGQQVIEIMCDSPRQLTNRLHFLALDKLGF